MPTSTMCVATIDTASNERRSRPNGKYRATNRVSAASAAQMPKSTSASAPARLAMTAWRWSPPRAFDRPVRNSATSCRRRAASAGQFARMLRQNTLPNGDAERSSTCASNSARRCASRSLPRCCASTASRRAKRTLASSVLRSFCSAARRRVTSGSSVMPAGGTLPSSPSCALRSSSWPVRDETNFCACAMTSLVCATSLRTSSLSSTSEGILSSCARRAGNVTSMASVASWARTGPPGRAMVIISAMTQCEIRFIGALSKGDPMWV